MKQNTSDISGKSSPDTPTSYSLHSSSSSSSSKGPKSTTSSLTNSSLSSTGEEDHQLFTKPQLPAKLRTQMQTSSSSGSICMEGRTISSSVSCFPKSQEDQPSQELFPRKSINDDEIIENSPELSHSPPKTSSTPFVNNSQTQRSAELSLQLSGDSNASSQPSTFIKPELNVSPSKKLQYSSSSSSEDDAKRKHQLPPETQGFSIPQWCQQHQNSSDLSLQSSSEGSLDKSINDTSCTSTKAASTISIGELSTADKSSDSRVSINKDFYSELLLLSGGDLFNPPDSENIDKQQQNNDVDPSQSQGASQVSFEFELSQDFSQQQQIVKDSVYKAKQSENKKKEEAQSDSQSSTPFHFSLKANLQKLASNVTTVQTHSVNGASPGTPDVVLHNQDAQVAPKHKQTIKEAVASNDSNDEEMPSEILLHNKDAQVAPKHKQTIKEVVASNDSNDGEIPGPSKKIDVEQTSDVIAGTIENQITTAISSTGLTLEDVISQVEGVFHKLRGAKENENIPHKEATQTTEEPVKKKIIENNKKQLTIPIPDSHCVEDIKTSVPELGLGSRVFALWNDGRYYAGTVTTPWDNERVTVVFYDRNVLLVSRDNICVQTLFKTGQEVLVSITGGYYVDGVVICSKAKRSGDQLCTVIVEKNPIIFETVEKISLTQEQFNNYSQGQCFENLENKEASTAASTIKSGKKRKAVSKTPVHKTNKLNPIISSSSTSSPEVTRSKRLKLSISETNGTVKLFDGYSFLLTSGTPRRKGENNSFQDTPPLIDSEDDTEESTEDEEAGGELDKNRLTELILRHGGIIIQKLNRRHCHRKSCKIICIANRIARTFKVKACSESAYECLLPRGNVRSVEFLYCVAVGIPILWDNFPTDCVNKNKILSYSSYLVPSGKDITGERVLQIYQTFTKPREIYTPLTPLRIFVHIKLNRDQNELNLLLDTIGCERISRAYSITKTSRKITFQMETIDYVLTLEKRVPQLLVDEALRWNKKIITVDWLIQCIINNQLFDVDTSPKFLYKPKERSASLEKSL